MYYRNCWTCNTEIDVSIGRPFCSPKCYKNRPPPIAYKNGNCLQCGGILDKKNLKSFCTRACYFEWRRMAGNKECQVCRTPLKFEQRNNTYCSNECVLAARSKGVVERAAKLKKRCVCCGIFFSPKNSIGNWFLTRCCSARCGAFMKGKPDAYKHDGKTNRERQRETRPERRLAASLARLERVRGRYGQGIWARLIKHRDGHKCQNPECRRTERLEAHHIKEFHKYPEKRWSLENGITLCFWCHIHKLHGRNPTIKIISKNGVNTVVSL